MQNNYDSHTTDLSNASLVKELRLRELYLGHRDRDLVSLWRVGQLKKLKHYDLPLVGPNRLPPEYLAA